MSACSTSAPSGTGLAGLPAVEDGHPVPEDDGALCRCCADHPGAAKEEEVPWCHGVGFGTQQIHQA